MKQRKNKSNQRKSKSSLPKEGVDFYLTPRLKVLVSSKILTARFITRPLTRYHNFFARFKILKLLANCVGWGALAYSVYTIGFSLWIQLIGNIHTQHSISISDIISYVHIIKSNSPIYTAINYLVTFVFSFLSLGFMTSLLEMEQITVDAAFQNRPLPLKSLVLKGWAVFSGSQYMFFHGFFEIFVVIYFVMIVVRYLVICRSRRNKFLFARNRYWIKEDKLSIRFRQNYYLYDIYSREFARYPLSRQDYEFLNMP
jgi:hypothetical protein